MTAPDDTNRPARPRWAALLTLLLAAPPAAADGPAASAFLQAHCVKCHGPAKQAGDVRLDDLPADPGKAADRWAAVRDQVRDGLMPPPKEPRPDGAAARRLVAWATSALAEPPARLPNGGNLVPHELLFGPAAPPAAPAPGRVWRLSPAAYDGWLADLYRGRLPPLTQPFTLAPDRGIRDFAGLYTIDEPTADVLLRNAATVVDLQTGTALKGGKKGREVFGGNDAVPEFRKLVDPAAPPTGPQLEAAVQTQFRLAIGRPATADEVARFLKLYEACAAEGDRPAAAKTMLQAVLLKTDALYRSELGAGPGGRRMLAADELARAVSLTLGDRRDPGLSAAARKGELATKEQVAAHVRRLLDDPKGNGRVPRFFREYFEYHKAPDVFKDRPRDVVFDPRGMVEDTDLLVRHVLAADTDVLRRLLTTDESFVNAAVKKDKATRRDVLQRNNVPNPFNTRGQAPPEAVYGLEPWPSPQPVKLPPGTRLGVLMQPSWLVAWSTNFDTDPVRRGRWVRERLLGGTVPDLPIGVAAQVADEPDQPYRHRLRVTHESRCWKCHQKMDDLGLPFEQFDHYGRFRTAETVLDPAGTPPVDPKTKKPAGPATKDVPLDTTGAVADGGDPAVDGPVNDPRELVMRLANSARVRQVFVRHAFRYFLGRNESLSDARALQDADRAYVESGGSFKALVVSLLTSDAFLYRSAPGDRP